MRKTNQILTVGLDIGSRCLKAVLVENGVFMKWRSVQRINPLIYRNREIIDREALVAALQKMFRETGFDSDSNHWKIVLSVPARKIQVRQILMERKPQHSIEKAVRFEIEHYFPSSMEEDLAGYRILDSDSLENPFGRVLVSVTGKGTVEDFKELMVDADRPPAVITSSIFMLPEILFENPGERDVAAYLDLGYESTNLYIFKAGYPLFAREMTPGLSGLIEIIKTDLSIEQKERFLLSSKSSTLKETARWIEITGKICEKIKEAIEESPGGGEDLSHIVVGGGGACIPSLFSDVRKTFIERLEIMRANPFRMFTGMDNAGDDSDPIFSEAVSLAAWGRRN